MCNSSKYNLNDFCNIIARLRKNKSWTQTMLADKLGVSPQSVSKWECGIGYPDVTLFPKIANTFNVPIGVLFGENSIIAAGYIDNKNSIEFDICKNIKVSLGNVCCIEFIEEVKEKGFIKIQGDAVFRHYFDVEKDNDTLFVNIKNPSGSQAHWNEYDRLGFSDKNIVQIFTGCKKDMVNIEVVNFLDLKVISEENEKQNYEVRCYKI